MARIRTLPPTRALTLVATLAGLSSCRQNPMTAEAVPTVHDVAMVLEGTRYRFRPAVVVAHAGDLLRFTYVSGGPHDVAFLRDSLSLEAQDALDAAMPGDKLGPMLGPLLVEPGDTYQFVVPELSPGRYPFLCIPHAAMGMVGELIVP